MAHAKKPIVYVIAGPNGAGKTTFATKFLPEYGHCEEFINADLLAAGLAPLKPENAAFAAGRLLLKRLKELSRKKSNFAFETTLSGKSYRRFLARLQRGGFEVFLFYLWIPHPSLALRRIEERVALGGHNVAAAVVTRRFPKSLANLFGYYWGLADRIILLDNSSLTPALIASKDES
ncbi:MAG: zeta toxin family protein, partial [Elusimicrobiota bacterium]